MERGRLQAGRTLSADEFWDRVRTMNADLRMSFSERLCFGLDGWTGARIIAEWALGESALRSVQFNRNDESAEVLVATSEDDVDGPLHHIIWNLPSEEPFKEQMNRLRASQVPAVSERIELPVSGQLVCFNVRSVNDYLIADATVENRRIFFRARNIRLEALQIERIDDIEPYLDGRNALIRKARAEQGIIDPE